MLPHDLPVDVFFMILMFFEHRDIYNYLKASLRSFFLISYANADAQAVNLLHVEQAIKSLSGDKRDWEYLFNMAIKNRHLPIPINLRNIDDVEARDIASWFIHSTMLYNGYTTPNRKLSVRKIDIKSTLRVTWLKLLLGNLCLIAAASDVESELTVWRVQSNLQAQPMVRKYLDAPVMDGKVDYCDDEVRCAITVGATHEYILVLGISQSSGGVTLQQLAHIPGSSSVKYLRGDLIGFACRNGDDTYPYLVNWKIGDIHSLQFPHNDPQLNCPLPIEPCKSFIVTDGLIFTLHANAVQVFGVPGGIYDDGSSHLSALPLRKSAACGSFLDVEQRQTGRPVVRLVYQDTEAQLRQVAILFDLYSLSTRTLSIRETTMEQVPDRGILHYWTLGSAERTIVGLYSSLHFRRMPSVIFASFKATNQEDPEAPLVSQEGYVAISDENLPPSQLITFMDFDDGHGQLLIGSAMGDALLASVLDESVMTPGSVKNAFDISSRRIGGREKLYEIPISLDLPSFYNIRQFYSVDDQLSQDIVSQVSAEWSESQLGIMSLGDWTNDWSRFERIWDWILPLSRWGPLDKDFLTVTVRYRLHTVGEMIPILYRISNHEEVVFRVGKRLYYSNQDTKDEHGHEMDVSANDDYGFQGVLPFSYDHFIDNPQGILLFIQDHQIQTNLNSWTYPRALSHRLSIAYWGYQSHAPREVEIESTEESSSCFDEDWPRFVDEEHT
ncbi:hypothetical protein ACEPAI_4484 [Sanghuangporus weigelae]